MTIALYTKLLIYLVFSVLVGYLALSGYVNAVLS